MARFPFSTAVTCSREMMNEGLISLISIDLVYYTIYCLFHQLKCLIVPNSGCSTFGGAIHLDSQTVHLYAPQTTRKSTLIHRILSQKIRKCIWPRFILRLKMSTNRSKKLSCIITRILLGCQHNGNNTVRIPLGEC